MFNNNNNNKKEYHCEERKRKNVIFNKLTIVALIPAGLILCAKTVPVLQKAPNANPRIPSAGNACNGCVISA